MKNRITHFMRSPICRESPCPLLVPGDQTGKSVQGYQHEDLEAALRRSQARQSMYALMRFSGDQHPLSSQVRVGLPIPSGTQHGKLITSTRSAFTRCITPFRLAWEWQETTTTWPATTGSSSSTLSDSARSRRMLCAPATQLPRMIGSTLRTFHLVRNAKSAPVRGAVPSPGTRQVSSVPNEAQPSILRTELKQAKDSVSSLAFGKKRTKSPAQLSEQSSSKYRALGVGTRTVHSTVLE